MLKDTGQRTNFEWGAMKDLWGDRVDYTMIPTEFVEEIYDEYRFMNDTEISTIWTRFLSWQNGWWYIKLIKRIFDMETGVILKNPTIPTDVLERLARHYMNWTKKYERDNWKKYWPEIKEIAKQSTWRHFISWFDGEEDEDHAMAIVFWIITYEWHKKKGTF